MIYDQNFTKGCSDINVNTNVLVCVLWLFLFQHCVQVETDLKKIIIIFFYVPRTFVSFAMVSEYVNNVYSA